MKRILFVVACVGGSVVACAALSPETTRERLLDRHLKARGGRQALENLQVIERSGSFTFHGMSPEIKGTYHTCLQYPDHVVVDIDAGPIQVHQALGHHGTFECDATFKTCTPARQEVVDELKSTVRIANREELEERVANPSALELIGTASAPTGYRYKKEEGIVEFDFAPDTGLLRRVKRGSRERRYGDWRDVGGVLLPMHLEDFEEGKKTVTVALSYAEHRKELGPWCEERLSVTAGGSGTSLPK